MNKIFNEILREASHKNEYSKYSINSPGMRDASQFLMMLPGEEEDPLPEWMRILANQLAFRISKGYAGITFKKHGFTKGNIELEAFYGNHFSIRNSEGTSLNFLSWLTDNKRTNSVAGDCSAYTDDDGYFKQEKELDMNAVEAADIGEDAWIDLIQEIEYTWENQLNNIEVEE